MGNIKSLTLLIYAAVLFNPWLAAMAQADYNKVLCSSGAKREETCSVTLTKKSMLLKYASGRNETIKIAKIQNIALKDESRRYGFLLIRQLKKYVYSIGFLNVDNESDRVTLAFDDIGLSKEFESLLRLGR